MASLEHLSTGVTVQLAARHVIGRSKKCQLQIAGEGVSALHAELAWDGEAWHLHDLGSRNGTFVAGQRVPPGQRVALEPGAEIGFGEPARYRFVDASPPRLIAFGPDAIRVADGALLCLPTAGDCEAMILRDADERWVIESASGVRPLADEESIVVAGQPWQIHLPIGGAATREAHDGRAGAVDEGVLELAVSRDGEHVDLRVHQGEAVVALETRSHAFLLLALARARLHDLGQSHLAESEHGWMHRDEVIRELAIDVHLLNMWVYRARQQFAQAKLRDASQLIERREAAGQLRLGIRRLRIIEA